MSGMPILIQDFATGNYLTPSGVWTNSIQKAIQFEQVLRAWEEIEERSLCGVRIIDHRAERAASQGLAEVECPATALR